MDHNNPRFGNSPKPDASPRFGNIAASPKKVSPKTSFNNKQYDITGPLDPLTPAPPALIVGDNVGTVILRAQYDFKAETPEELSIKTNDYLKLLQRPGDGWIRVKHVANAKEGLIPASYVKITVNDLINPITHQWLNEILPLDASVTSEDLFDFEKHGSGDSQTLLPGAMFVTKSKSRDSGGVVYPKNISVPAVLKTGDVFLYRIDVKMSNGDRLYFCKTYQDFYDLHYDLSLLNFDNLPNFPQPIKSLHNPNSGSLYGHSSNSSGNKKKQLESILIKSNELNGYINRLVKLDYYKKSKELMEFICDTKQLLQNPANKTDEFINDTLLPNCINVIDLIHPYHNNNKKNFSPTAPLPMAESPSLTSFSSLIDSYEKPTSALPPTPESTIINTSRNFGTGVGSAATGSNSGATTDASELPLVGATSSTPANDGPTSVGSSKHRYKLSSSSTSSGTGSSTSRDRENSSSEADSIFSKHSPITPQNNVQQFDEVIVPSTPITPISPIFEPQNNFMSEFLKIKVILNNKENDIIVLKIKNSDLTTLKDLKKLISFKIYKDTELINHYKLMVNNKTLDDEELLNVIKSNYKTSLNLVRTRGSI